MTDALLLNKLINEYNDKNSFLFQCYKHSQLEKNLVDAFNQCISDLKALSELSYNFEALTKYSKQYNITRRDVRQLCEVLSSILGEAITQFCSQDRERIITKPSCFEDFCPYPKAELVVYSIDNKVNSIVKYDGNIYEVIESRAENTPYYFIYCYLLEKIQ